MKYVTCIVCETHPPVAKRLLCRRCDAAFQKHANANPRHRGLSPGIRPRTPWYGDLHWVARRRHFVKARAKHTGDR